MERFSAQDRTGPTDFWQKNGGRKMVRQRCRPDRWSGFRIHHKGTKTQRTHEEEMSEQEKAWDRNFYPTFVPPCLCGETSGRLYPHSPANLPSRRTPRSFCPMKTLTKPAAKKKRVARPALKKAAGKTLPLPPAKATAGDLLRRLHDGSYDAAAAKVDWDSVEWAVKNRRSSRSLRAAS